MPLRLYNTMTRQKEDFVPLVPGKVGIYVCGVTVYDRCHIGHARSQVVFDTIVRYLRHKGFDVTYVRNFTDVDDKIINRANELKVDWKDLVRDNIAAFYEDLDPLGIARPNVEPRATDHIAEMFDIIRALENKGLAYRAKDGSVYYSTRKFDGYCKLSKRNVDDLIEGARVDEEEKKYKKDVLDFALWKAAKPGEPTWESPWGPGRPGWHIECSAMSAKHLGQPFDIHGGGKDLVFPHHENEIAQSEGAHGKEFARYWMHNGFVQINQEKMAKSTGNFVTLAGIYQKYSADALRLLLLSAHYRSPIDYGEQSLAEWETATDRLYKAIEAIETTAYAPTPLVESALSDAHKAWVAEIAEAERAFDEAMDDDFNTAKSIGHLFDVVKTIASVLASDTDGPSASRDMTITRARAAFEEMRRVLGVLNQTPAEYMAGKKMRTLALAGLSAADIEAAIARRAEARRNKDWATSDAVRDELAAKGVVLMDSKGETTWTVK